MGVFLPIGEQQAHLDFTQRHSLPQAGHHGAAQAAVLGGRLAEADIDGVYLLNGGQVREFVLVGKCPFRHQRAAHAAGDGRFHLVYSRFRRACSRDAAAAAYSALARSSSAMACLCSRTLTAPLATREE